MIAFAFALHVLIWICAFVGAGALVLLAWGAFMDRVDPLGPTGIRPRNRRDG